MGVAIPRGGSLQPECGGEAAGLIRDGGEQTYIS